MRKTLLTLLLLSGCATQPQEITSIKLIYTDTPEKECGQPLIGRVLGCSRRKGDVCFIYAPRPHSSLDKIRFETIGHELMHCHEGHWHDQWGRMVRR